MGIINRGVLYKSTEVISKLYRLYVRCDLKYGIQFWTPINVKDANILKGAQKKVTKIISLKNLLYEDRLKRLGMFSLRHRKLRGNMIEMFKMIHGVDKVNLEKLFYIDEETNKYERCRYTKWGTEKNN